MRPSCFVQGVTFIYVTDLAKSANFYQEILGLALVLDQGTCRIFRVAGDSYLGLCETKNALANREGIILTLVSDDVDHWADYLISQNVLLEKPAQQNSTYNIYHCFLRDPDGYLIEIQKFLDPNWPQPLAVT